MKYVPCLQPSTDESYRIQNPTEAHSSLPVPDQYDVPQLVGRQDNTIQFDLQKVASDYQVSVKHKRQPLFNYAKSTAKSARSYILIEI